MNHRHAFQNRRRWRNPTISPRKRFAVIEESESHSCAEKRRGGLIDAIDALSFCLKN